MRIVSRPFPASLEAVPSLVVLVERYRAAHWAAVTARRHEIEHEERIA